MGLDEHNTGRVNRDPFYMSNVKDFIQRDFALFGGCVELMDHRDFIKMIIGVFKGVYPLEQHALDGDVLLGFKGWKRIQCIPSLYTCNINKGFSIQGIQTIKHNPFFSFVPVKG